MHVREAHPSNILVQTLGDIVVKIERGPIHSTFFRALLVRSRPYLLSSAVVALVALSLNEQTRHIDKRELRSTGRLDQLQAQIEALSVASTVQASHVSHVVEKLDHMETDVAAIPLVLRTTVQGSTSSLVEAMSSLELKPSFRNLYAAASGFRSESDAPPVKPPSAVAKPKGVSQVRRTRQASVPRRLSRPAGNGPAVPIVGGGFPQDDEPAVLVSGP